MTEQLPDLPDITRLSPRVVRILGGNPSKYTLQGTNTYLIGQGPKRLLLDTGEGKPAWAKSLQKALEDENVSIEKIILTHWHPDHVGGVKDALSLSSCSDAEVYKNQPQAAQQAGTDGGTIGYTPQAGQLDIQDGQKFQTEGATLRAFHSPGHTTDHMAFILEEEDAMFTGDNVLGHGTAVFEDLSAYMDSLERMKEQFAGRAYPAHGEVIKDGKAKIREYIAHRKEREEQIINVMKGESPKGDGEGWSSMSIVKIIYKDYPEHLHKPAEGSVLHVLRKMEGDGRLMHNKDGTWSLTKKAAL
jgi:glyoxylase-like metal-dependent hydrolase (beta-lactamase superfamily II)